MYTYSIYDAMFENRGSNTHKLLLRRSRIEKFTKRPSMQCPWRYFFKHYLYVYTLLITVLYNKINNFYLS